MAALVGSIYAKLQADAGPLNRNLFTASGYFTRFEKQAGASLGRLDRRFSLLGRGLGSAAAQVGAGALAAIAPLLTFGAAINTAKAALTDFDAIAKSAKATGFGAEAFQAYSYAAELGGVATDQFAKALETFAKNSGLAAVGKGRMVTALKALNPELLKNLKLATTQEQRLRLLADALDRETDASRKAAIATAAFGDVGTRMVEALKGGSAALDAMAAKARELGIVVNANLIARAEEMADEFETVTKVLDLQFKQALIELSPLIISVTSLMADLTRGVRDVFDSTAKAEEFKRKFKEIADIRKEISDHNFQMSPEQKPFFEGGSSGVGSGATANDLDIFFGAVLKARAALKEPLPDFPDLFEDATEGAEKFRGVVEKLRQQTADLQFEQMIAGLGEVERLVAESARDAGIAVPEIKNFLNSIAAADSSGLFGISDAFKAILEQVRKLLAAKDALDNRFNRRTVGGNESGSSSRRSGGLGGGTSTVNGVTVRRADGGLSKDDVATGVKSGVSGVEEGIRYVNAGFGFFVRDNGAGHTKTKGEIARLQGPVNKVSASVLKAQYGIEGAIGRLGSSSQLGASGGVTDTLVGIVGHGKTATRALLDKTIQDKQLESSQLSAEASYLNTVKQYKVLSQPEIDAIDLRLAEISIQMAKNSVGLSQLNAVAAKGNYNPLAALAAIQAAGGRSFGPGEQRAVSLGFASGGMIRPGGGGGTDSQAVSFFKSPREAVGIFTPPQMAAIGAAISGPGDGAPVGGGDTYNSFGDIVVQLAGEGDAKKAAAEVVAEMRRQITAANSGRQ